ncbi:MAG: ASCH domain-containing protein [Micrococcus sp.]|nr:ASCH domain-containing protein [Micrococcus sp.]
MTHEQHDEQLREFWAAARAAVPGVPDVAPEPWSFGGTAEEADALLALVLSGTKTATSSAAGDYAAENEPLPVPGSFSVVTNGRGVPRAVFETTRVKVVPFGEVTAEHAAAEGEGDGSLESWRAEHERFWREHAVEGFDPAMGVVCEEFRVVYVAPVNRS